jgi:pimeloyl-ACP methyl ester carboxylesterase
MIYRTVEGGRIVRDRYRALLDRWPVESERLTVATRAGDTFVLASGPADAPPVVALHGSGSNALTWMADIATWVPELRVYAVDVIGEPGLSASSRPPLDSPQPSKWLDDVLAGLGLTSTALLGMSLGGLLAVDYATRRPDRVSRLALLAPGGIGRRKTGWLVRALPFLFLGDWGRRRIARAVAGGAAEDLLVATFKHFRPRLAIPVFDDDALRRLTMPTLAIVGDRDVMIDSRETARRLAETVPHADVRLLPDAGHHITGQALPLLEFLR